jgi:hypothetical protein
MKTQIETMWSERGCQRGSTAMNFLIPGYQIEEIVQEVRNLRALSDAQLSPSEES